jgi:hypothetical protein
MNSLPIESSCWREHLRQRIKLETSIFRALIQWGMAESACEVCRTLEEHFGDYLEAQSNASLRKHVRPSEHDRAFVRSVLQEAFLRTRQIPRWGLTQARLHDGVLTGFEELSLSILQCYEGFLSSTQRCGEREKAA